MECPHCHEVIRGKECPECEAMIPLESRFCMNCGKAIEKASEPPADGNEYDIDNRVLCSDGTCTGIIVQNRCTECGKPPR